LVAGDEFCRSCGTALADVASVAGPPAEPSARKTGRIALIVAAVVLGLLLLAGVVFLVAFMPWSTHIQEVPTAGTSTSGASGSQVTTSLVGGAGAASSAVTPPSATTKQVVVTPAKPNPDANDVTHQATFIKKTGVADGGAHTMTFDYVQFLTGSAAIHAATAHGDTADNDYYVVNDNPKLRTFPVASSVLIKLHSNDAPQYSRIFDLSEFEDLMTSGTQNYSGRSYGWNAQQTYYINVLHGKVTRIENIWTP
jgi:hypothetical protein